MPHFPRLLLAAASDAAPPPLPVPVTRVHTGCCVSERGTILAAENADWSGGLLMVSGDRTGIPPDAERFCRQLTTICHTHSVSGIVANWPSTPAWSPLTVRLDRTTAQEGLSLRVPEFFADSTRHARILVASQLSGGTFSRRLQDARKRWGTQVTLMVECVPWRFSLPCPPGQEQPLDREQLEHMLSRRPHVWFSKSLCAQYFTCSSKDGPRLILFDNAASVRQKLELAAQCQISEALLSWEEVRPFSDTLFRTDASHGG